MLTKLKENKKYQAIALVVVMLVSIAFSFVAKNPNTYTHTISTLDEKRADALLLTATVSAAAVGVTAIPTEATDPIAELLTEISSYGIIITCIITLEKFLLTTFGVISFSVLFPIAILMYIIYLFNKKDPLKAFSVKLTIFATVLFLIIPASTGLSVMIEKTLNVDYEKAAVELEQATEETSKWDAIKGETSKIVDFVKAKVNKFIDNVSVMLITACFIPLGVLAFLLWLTKHLFNVNLNIPNPKILSAKLNKTRQTLLNKSNEDILLIE